MTSANDELRMAIVATLCEHPSAEKYRQRAFIDSPEKLFAALAEPIVLKKEDFFALDLDNKSFMDLAGTWKNFDKISKLVRLSGDRFTFADFTRPLQTGYSSRTPLDIATNNNALAKVFAVDVWSGHFKEFEKLWYTVPRAQRDKLYLAGGLYSTEGTGLIPLAVKRELLAAEGKIPPEDRLEQAGVTPEDIRKSAVDPVAFEVTRAKLQRAGDYFRKEYLLLPDVTGEGVFDNRDNAWNAFGEFQKILHEHGERFEVEDFTRQLSTTVTMLSRAQGKGLLDKIFAAESWIGRLPDMARLWTHVPDAWKTGKITPQAFDKLYASAENMTYAPVFAARGFAGKVDLLTPLNDGTGEARPVLALGLPVVWDNIDAIQAKLAENGEKISLADLRATSGQMGDSCLIAAVKFNKFDKVFDIVRKNRDVLTYDDLTSADAQGKMLIQFLGENQQLPLIFTEKLWVGRVDEMRRLWALVPTAQRKQVDFDRIEVAARQLTLKQVHGNKPGPLL